MSLFQAREWWGFRPDSEDECTPAGMVLGNVDNDLTGSSEFARIQGVQAAPCQRSRAVMCMRFRRACRA